MTLDDIVDLWIKEGQLDDTELDRESLNIPLLHGKFLKILSTESLKLRRLKLDHKILYKTLTEYYQGDLNNPEDLADIGRDPWPKRVVKQDIDKYIDGDPAMNKLLTKIAYQEEVVDVCKEILKSINQRQFIISNSIKWRQLTQFGQG